MRDYSQYKYYHFVVNHGAMEAVAEALVRSRYNLIIPASFLNATRPAEEGLAAICAARGVFVSMHHIEPMGVSGYTFKDYWKQRGSDLEYSYFYTCGPEPMLKAVYRTSKTEGQLSFEKRMGCGFGACMGCSCRTVTGWKRICKEGPVLRKEEILWEN